MGEQAEQDIDNMLYFDLCKSEEPPMPRKTELVWRETSYHQRHAFDAGGRLVGVIEWQYDADDWSAAFAWVCPHVQLGVHNSEARARAAVEAEYALRQQKGVPSAPKD